MKKFRHFLTKIGRFKGSKLIELGTHMPKKEPQELIVHIPEVDRNRRRWFLISVVSTTLMVVVGWGYFLLGQLSGFAQAVPQTFASDIFRNAVEESRAFGREAKSGFKSTVAPVVTKAVGQLQTRLEAESKVGVAVELITEQLASQTSAAETTTSDAEANP